MGSFDLEMSSPFASGADGNFYGGPRQGGHQGPHWYIEFGMDLGAPGGTEVRAVFEGKISVLDTTHINVSTGHVYGAGVFVRADVPGVTSADSPDGVGAFYTHVNNLPDDIVQGAHIERGQVIGQVVDTSTSHLHMAVAVRLNEQYRGADLYDFFKDTINTTAVTSVRLFDDGVTPPEVLSDTPAQPPDGVEPF